MPAKATERIALRPNTKDILDDRKPEGVTYDHYVRELLGVSTD